MKRDVGWFLISTEFDNQKLRTDYEKNIGSFRCSNLHSEAPAASDELTLRAQFAFTQAHTRDSKA